MPASDVLEPPPAKPAVAQVPPHPDAPAAADASGNAGQTAQPPGTPPASAVPDAARATASPAPAVMVLARSDDLAAAPGRSPRGAPGRRRTAPAARIEAVASAEAAPRSADAAAAAPAEDRIAVRATELPGNLAARLAESWDFAQKGKLDEAQAGYESVLASDRRNVDAMLGLAAIAWQQGRTDRAGEFYDRVLELDPQNAAAQAGLVGMLGRTDPVASETRLRNLIAREPSGQLYFTLGNLYASQSQWAQAQQAYFQAFQSEPGNPDYAFNLAVGLDRLGQRKPALDYYRRAVDLSFARGRAGFDQKAAIARIARLASTVE